MASRRAGFQSLKRLEKYPAVFFIFHPVFPACAALSYHRTERPVHTKRLKGRKNKAASQAETFCPEHCQDCRTKPLITRNIGNGDRLLYTGQDFLPRLLNMVKGVGIQ